MMVEEIGVTISDERVARAVKGRAERLTRAMQEPEEGIVEGLTALKEAGVKHAIHRYDANHAFANPSSARYDEKSAAAAWKEVRAFLRRELMPGR